jgi:transcriptional regulator with XRE-family HTH domain
MDLTDDYKLKSDHHILKELGEFIKHNRLQQNKTQQLLAKEAGINRSTLSEFEQGKRSNTITFIQLLRALNILNVLEVFKIEEQISPLQLAKLEKKKRKRARKVKESQEQYLSDW